MTSVVEWFQSLVSVAWLPAAIASAGALAALVADMFDARKTGLVLAWAGLAAATVVSIAASLLPVGPSGSVVTTVFGSVLAGGAFAGLAGVVYFTAFLSVASGLASIRENARVAVAALIAIGAATGQVLLGASDVVVLFVALELLALVAYALVAASGTDRSDEAAARYFVQGAVASGLVVLGLAVVVGLSGGASAYSVLPTALADLVPGAALLGAMLFVSALAFKVGAFPFHSWVPDAYETAPSGAAAFLASGVKAAAIGAFGVFVFRLMSADLFVPALLAIRILAAASIVFGNIAALRQSSVARMLGYSAIAQVGYALVGVSVAPAVSPRDTFLFAATYAIGSVTAFVVLEYLHGVRPEWDGSVDGLAGLARRHPAASLSLTVAMLSMTGIPLTVGFWGKFFVFYAATAAGFLWLTIVGLIGSVVSFGYYGAVIRSLYIDGTEHDPGSAQDPEIAAAPSSPLWPSVVGAAVIVAGGVAPIASGLAVVYALFRL